MTPLLCAEDVSVAYGRRLALDPLFDGPEDLDVGAAMIPLFINEVCRFGAGRRGHAVTFSLKTVA